ncbi:MAG: hypothetical protein NT116_02555 [Candidatus Parcubacteria bacterium]|nr:hypothetical protein [Candidatus Parcubacteria bacterium]
MSDIQKKIRELEEQDKFNSEVIDQISDQVIEISDQFSKCKEKINERLSNLEQCECKKEEKIPRSIKGKYPKKEKKSK